MDDLDKFIELRKKKSIIFSKNFAKGYEQFKIKVIFKQAHLESDPTQKAVAQFQVA